MDRTVTDEGDAGVAATVGIVGAGPAGSLAAILLARAGFHVTLIEQHRFPRDKVCGECLSALGIQVLERAGLVESLRARGPVLLRRTLLHPPTGSSIDVRLPRTMWGLSRHELDAALLDVARDAGATVLQPARCEALTNSHLRVRMLESNELRDIETSWVLLADGKGALLPRRPDVSGELGVKAHFVNLNGAAPDAIELFGLDGHYAGLAPIDAGRWNLAFSVPAARVASLRGDFDELLSRMMRENDALRARLTRATRVGRWLTTPLPRFSTNDIDWPPLVIPVGNAAAALEPIGGEGIGLAMRSAELAAEELIAGRDEDRSVDVAKLRRQFARLWRVRSIACRAAGVLMSSRRIADGIAPLVERAAPLQQVAMALMGK